jgi:hemerythrin-like domain-containing protein
MQEVVSVATSKQQSGYDRRAWQQEAAKKPPRKTRDEQPMMKTLRAEHRQMASVMKLFTTQLDAIERGEIVDTHVVYEIMSYMVTTPDRFHHPREDVVYQRAAEKDADAADSVDVLQREHDAMARQSRAVLKAIEQWRDGSADGSKVVKEGRAYIDKLYNHMNLEEQVVFPQIEALLTVADWRELELEDQLTPARDPVFGGAVDREFRNLARKLRRGVRRGVERATLVEWIGVEALMEAVEVVSIGYDSGRDVTREHLRTVLDESLETLRNHPFTAFWRCGFNNTRHTVDWLGELAGISRDTLEDLAKVNRERRDRVRLLDMEQDSGS